MSWLTITVSRGAMYKRHPALTNPGRWVRGPKKHHPDVYVTPPYDITTNPFAQALQETRSDCAGGRLPIGVMTKLTVDPGPPPTVVPLLRPVLHASYYYPSSYILSNRLYIASRKLGAQFVPRKWTHHNASVMNKMKNIRFCDGFIDRIDQFHHQQLLKALEQDFNDGDGLAVTVADTGPLLEYNGDGEPRINLKEVYPDYSGVKRIPLAQSGAVFAFLNWQKPSTNRERGSKR